MKGFEWTKYGEDDAGSRYRLTLGNEDLADIWSGEDLSEKQPYYFDDLLWDIEDRDVKNGVNLTFQQAKDALVDYYKQAIAVEYQKWSEMNQQMTTRSFE